MINHRPTLCLVATAALLAACGEGSFDQTRHHDRSDGGTRSEFPAIFEPALWDLDPQLGDAIAGTDFDADGGRRKGILQLFVSNTLNLKAFLDQQEARLQETRRTVAGGTTTLVRTGRQVRFTQSLRRANGQTIHTGAVVLDGATIVSFTHNLATNAFDGEYTSPADRNTRHRMITAPLRNGSFVQGSAYDLLDDGRANYTHVGLVDRAFKAVRLLEFIQVDRQFAETARELAEKVAAAVADNDGAAPPASGRDAGAEEPPVRADAGGADGAGGAGGAGNGGRGGRGGAAADAGGVVGRDAGAGARADAGAGAGADTGAGAAAGAFPPLLDVRFFQLDIAGNGGPANSGPIFEVVNAVAKNSVDDLQRLVDASRVTIERDAQGRAVEVRKTEGFESRQTFERGVQEGVALVDGKKRFQFIRNHDTGRFEGLIIAPSSDLSAPIAAFVIPRSTGTARHLIIEDLANNLKNDYRGELIVDARTLKPISFSFFQQFQGGLAAQEESAALVEKFGFEKLIQGF